MEEIRDENCDNNDSPLRQAAQSAIENFIQQSSNKDQKDMARDCLDLIRKVPNDQVASIIARYAALAYERGEIIQSNEQSILDPYSKNALYKALQELIDNHPEGKIHRLIDYIDSLKVLNEYCTGIAKTTLASGFERAAEQLSHYYHGDISLATLHKEQARLMHEMIDQQEQETIYLLLSTEAHIKNTTLACLANYQGLSGLEAIHWNETQIAAALDVVRTGQDRPSDRYEMKVVEHKDSTLKKISKESNQLNALNARLTRAMRILLRQVQCPWDLMNWHVRVPNNSVIDLNSVFNNAQNSYLPHLQACRELQADELILLESSQLSKHQVVILEKVFIDSGVKHVHVAQSQEGYFLQLSLDAITQMDQLIDNYFNKQLEKSHTKPLISSEMEVKPEEYTSVKTVGTAGDLTGVSSMLFGISSRLMENYLSRNVSKFITDTGNASFSLVNIALNLTSLTLQLRTSGRTFANTIDLAFLGANASYRALSCLIPIVSQTHLGSIFMAANMVIDDIKFAHKYWTKDMSYRDLVVRVGRRCSNVVALYNATYKVYAPLIQELRQEIHFIDNIDEADQAQKYISELESELKTMHQASQELIHQLKREIVEINVQKQIDVEKNYIRHTVSTGVGAMLIASMAVGPFSAIGAAAISFSGVVLGAATQISVGLNQETLIDNPVRMVQGIYELDPVVHVNSSDTAKKAAKELIAERSIISLIYDHPEVLATNPVKNIDATMKQLVRKNAVYNLNADTIKYMKLLDSFDEFRLIEEQLECYLTACNDIEQHLAWIMQENNLLSCHPPIINNLNQILARLELWSNNLQYRMRNTRQYMLNDKVKNIPQYCQVHTEDTVIRKFEAIEKLCQQYQKNNLRLLSSEHLLEQQLKDYEFIQQRQQSFLDEMNTLLELLLFIRERGEDKVLANGEQIRADLINRFNAFLIECGSHQKLCGDLHKNEMDEFENMAADLIDAISEKVDALSPKKSNVVVIDESRVDLEALRDLSWCPGLNRPLQANEFAMLEYRFRGTEQPLQNFRNRSVQYFIDAMNEIANLAPNETRTCFIIPPQALSKANLREANVSDIDLHLRGIERALWFYNTLLNHPNFPEGIVIGNLSAITDSYLNQLILFDHEQPNNVTEGLKASERESITQRARKLGLEVVSIQSIAEQTFAESSRDELSKKEDRSKVSRGDKFNSNN